MKYNLSQIFVIKKFHLALILIFLAIGMNDLFIMNYLNKITGTDNLLWIFRFGVLLILILFGLHNYLSYFKLKLHYLIFIFLIAFVVLISSFNSFISLTDFTKNLLGHVFYIYIILYLLSSKEIITDKTIQFIGVILLLLGALSSLSFLLLGENNTVRDPAGTYLNIINFPTFGFIGLLLISQKRVLIFYMVIMIILLISFLEINRSLFIAVIIFYLIIQKKDLGIFKLFSYSTWIILSLITTLIVGILEFEQLSTTTFSTGRGQIWMINWMQFINLDFLSILFGNTINYDNTFNISENFDQINLSMNFFQLHSTPLKTLLDYGIIGFILIMIIFKNKKQYRFDHSYDLINALFFSCFLLVSLNSSTSFIKMDIYVLLMFVALAASNKNYRFRNKLNKQGD